MHNMFDGKPVMQTIVKVGIVLFIGLSLVNLYYSIQVNKKLLKKAE